MVQYNGRPKVVHDLSIGAIFNDLDLNDRLTQFSRSGQHLTLNISVTEEDGDIFTMDEWELVCGLSSYLE